MKISMIAAMASNRTIGLNNQLPWHLSADLKKFKQLTLGKPILMGRKTHESIGRVLPGRLNVILTSAVDYHAPNCKVVNNLSEALSSCATMNELFIIGGASLYQAFLPKADKLYLTIIDEDFAGDTFFPELPINDWQEIERIDIDNDPSVNFRYSFITLARITPNNIPNHLLNLA